MPFAACLNPVPFSEHPTSRRPVSKHCEEPWSTFPRALPTRRGRRRGATTRRARYPCPAHSTPHPFPRPGHRRSPSAPSRNRASLDQRGRPGFSLRSPRLTVSGPRGRSRISWFSTSACSGVRRRTGPSRRRAARPRDLQVRSPHSTRSVPATLLQTVIRSRSSPQSFSDTHVATVGS